MNYSVEYTGTGTLSSVKWTFGDGTTGDGTTVTHTYNAAGTYEAKAMLQLKKMDLNALRVLNEALL